MCAKNISIVGEMEGISAQVFFFGATACWRNAVKFFIPAEEDGHGHTEYKGDL